MVAVGQARPERKNTFSGADAGAGAAMAWVGNKKVGAGKMTITESQPSGLIRFRLLFQKPMQATNTAEFTFRAEAGQTVVTWSMAGKSCFMSKVFGLFMDFDKMCGCQFEKGAGQREVRDRKVNFILKQTEHKKGVSPWL